LFQESNQGEIAMATFTKKGKIVLSVLVIVPVIVILYWLGNTDEGKEALNIISPSSSTQTTGMTEEIDGIRPIRFGVVTWGGYAGGQYFNNGFKASKESRFFTEYGVPVEFVVLDDFNASREALKADEIDAVWVTADAYPTEVEAMKEFDPKFFFQADWSRGGDAIVVRQGINSMNDLIGKTVAVANGTPSHTFLLKMLKASNIPYTSIKVVEVASAIDAASTFKSQSVDCAVVWSPDDQDCIRSVNGSKILISTKTATNIIADGFYCKGKTLREKGDQLRKVVEGWLKGNAEINSSNEAKEKAIRILMDGLNLDEQLARNAINNVRLVTFGDNQNFFGLNPSYTGVTGQNLYSSMAIMYSQIRDKAGISLAPSRVPAWNQVSTTSFISGLNLTNTGDHAPEGQTRFAEARPEDRTATAITSMAVSINFPTGSATLSEDAKYIIDSKLADVAQSFASARVRIEGHTDNVGNPNSNMALSQRRAQAVANYLTTKYRFDPRRFIVTGFGDTKPIADNYSDDGRAQNRRTEFQIIP
jgi:NitT/TauT family transport system substrate-binding protein